MLSWFTACIQQKCLVSHMDHSFKTQEMLTRVLESHIVYYCNRSFNRTNFRILSNFCVPWRICKKNGVISSDICLKNPNISQLDIMVGAWRMNCKFAMHSELQVWSGNTEKLNSLNLNSILSLNPIQPRRYKIKLWKYISFANKTNQRYAKPLPPKKE